MKEASIRRSILLIDDEVSFRGGVARYLRRAGFVVHEASDGSEVARVVDSVGAVDVVVTDINMSETDGLEVIRKLRSEGSDVPVIAISGGGVFSKELLLRNAGYLGARATLEKPFELGALRALIERILNQE